MRPMSNTAWMIPENICPRIVLTAGEPAGIGPDIIIAAAWKTYNAELIVAADPTLIRERAKLLNRPVELVMFKTEKAIERHRPGELKILPVTHNIVSKPGKPDIADASYVLETLTVAVKGCLKKIFAAMITAPVHKAIINQAGYPFTGHTEFLGEVCGEGYPVMMLADNKLRIALVTTHMPLAKVSQAITHSRLEQVLNILWHDLRNRFGIADPAMLVCGLNPHAGEDGHLGKEELEVIIPTLDTLRHKGMQITGPVPADTAFTDNNLDKVDVVVTMYHDQGLPVLKARGFGEIVNITLGLPIIRTSVDHGTALSLAGTGQANSSSLEAAIHQAIDLAVTCQHSTGLFPEHTSDSVKAI
jgi:4-hydroxythreonine-4-phosphate dehydrogenase